MSVPHHLPAGSHLLADLYGVSADKLVCCEAIDRLLRAGAAAAGARILHSHFHSFGEAQGVTGVLLLAESHISIHTWPEFGFAAADIFMCGAAEPQRALALIEHALQPRSRIVQCIARGAAGTLAHGPAGPAGPAAARPARAAAATEPIGN
ncbi:adenosylmethionine decarboxylase [Massilia glaciei]|uniref:S-adenosylmethionine decarboxylase proenzyme n=1 Tax=Massilia glaciei TaxID=1524097 RepID=A0A2U2HEJ7_9BURK|nr:adenosylmethionine decarboxylase [Massilia glaciei]